MKDIPFLEHLEILRQKIIFVFFTFLVLFLFFFFSGERVLSFLTAPLSGVPAELVYLKPQEKITAYLNASLFAAFLFSFPLLVVQLAIFVFPALKKGEKHLFFLVTCFALLLFITGIAFAYLILLPFASLFFFSFSSGDGIRPYWSIGSYVELASSLVFVTGCIFMSPLPLMFLIRSGIIGAETLARYRRHVLISVFIVSAVMTPPDIYTQITVAAVLYLLFELTLLFSGFYAGKKEKQ